MKISNSAVAMTASHSEASYTYKESASIEAVATKDAAGAILTLSKEASGQSYLDSMETYSRRQKEEAAKQQQQNEARSLAQMAKNLQANNEEIKLPEDVDMKIKMLRQILAALRGEKIPEDCKFKRTDNAGVLDLRSAGFRQMESLAIKLSDSGTMGLVSVGTNSFGTLWQKVTATSGTYTEAESTTFASKGLVQTTDGRTIDFNIEVSMTRAFTSRIDSLEVQEYIKTDPLVINLDTNACSVSDQKFLFDLDSDGQKEEISFAGKGSGFLALDKDGDGVINDGSELFGTKSGDGFKDLLAFDEDGNGWIDENDSVFKKLKIWMKDENGKDVLLNLKQADVGAIYLGNADTQFSLKNSSNQLNAEIKKTGIYLKESTGAVGTVNHVDIAV